MNHYERDFRGHWDCAHVSPKSFVWLALVDQILSLAKNNIDKIYLLNHKLEDKPKYVYNMKQTSSNGVKQFFLLRLIIYGKLRNICTRTVVRKKKKFLCISGTCAWWWEACRRSTARQWPRRCWACSGTIRRLARNFWIWYITSRQSNASRYHQHHWPWDHKLINLTLHDMPIATAVPLASSPDYYLIARVSFKGFRRHNTYSYTFPSFPKKENSVPTTVLVFLSKHDRENLERSLSKLTKREWIVTRLTYVIRARLNC